MADFASSLPVRTESAGDVIIKVADATVTSQQMKVNADGSVDVNFAAASKTKVWDGTDELAINADGSVNATVSATDLDIRDLNSATDSVSAVQAGNWIISDIDNPVTISNIENPVTVQATDLDIRDLVFATDKVDVSGSSVTVSATDLDVRDLNSASDSVSAVQSGTWTIDSITNAVTVSSTDLDIRDLSHASDSVKLGDGTDFLAINTDGSINVKVADSSPGTETTSYNTASAIAAGASSTHTYTSTGNFYLQQIAASASGALKVEIQVNGATKYVGFTDAANLNYHLNLAQPILATSGQTVTVIRTNRDKQAQDLYSTIAGYLA